VKQPQEAIKDRYGSKPCKCDEIPKMSYLKEFIDRNIRIEETGVVGNASEVSSSTCGFAGANDARFLPTRAFPIRSFSQL